MGELQKRRSTRAEKVTSFQPVNHWYRSNPEQKSSKLLILAALLGLAVGIGCNWLLPTLTVFPILYGTWAGISLIIGIGGLINKGLGQYERLWVTIILVSGYLLIVLLAFLNYLPIVWVALLASAQLVMAFSFSHWVEYALFALISLGVFWFCTMYIPELLLSPPVFMLIMVSTTAVGGLFSWVKMGKLDPETPADELISHLIDQDDAALFLLDATCERIIFRNYAAARLLSSLELGGDIDGVRLLAWLELEAPYLQERMEASHPASPEKHYRLFTPVSGKPHKLELALSKLVLPDTYYFRIRVKDITKQVAHNQRIERALSVHRALVEAIPDWLLTVDAHDIVSAVYAPQGSREQQATILGRSVDYLAHAYLSPAHQETLQQLCAHTRKTLRPGQMAIEVDGRYGRQHFELRLIAQKGGELLAIVRDMSESRQAQEALAQSEAYYRQIFDTATDCLIILDQTNFHPIDANKEAAAVLGYDLGALNTRSASDLVPTEEFMTFTRALQAAAEHTPQELKLELLDAQQMRVPVHMQIKSIQLDGNDRLVLIFRNITEQLQHEAALSHSASRYQNLVENMNEGIVMTDLDERILFVNQRAEAMLGLPQKDILGKYTYELLPHSDNPSTIQHKNQLRRQGVSDQYVLKFERTDGEIAWLLIAGSPYIDERGNIVGTIAIITDITARKLAEFKLSEKNNEMDAFIYKASHDLRGPLASIIGVTSFARGEVSDPSALQYFGMIEKSTKRLDLILGELIDVTHMNKAELVPERLEMRSLVQAVKRDVMHLEGAKDVDIIVNVELPRPILSDRQLLTSILHNLLNNAIMYRNPTAENAYAHINIWHDEKRLFIKIADNGLGIPDRVQGRIFEMFYRGNNQSRGSGLGLYIVKNATEKLGGKVSFESQESVGTTFTISLPLEFLPAPERVM